MSKNKNLVADLGGTNIRFGLCETKATQAEEIRKYKIRDYESFSHLLEVYLSDCNTTSKSIRACCIAVAGPINNNQVKMTNCDWKISTAEIQNTLGIEQAILINDFHAIALSVAYLDPDGIIDIASQSSSSKEGPVSVFGPGTGLGAAILIPDGEEWSVITTEAGHAGLSARTDEELFAFNYWREKGCRINREFFICGTGIERIYESICVAHDKDDYKKRQVSDIQQLGCTGKDALCEQTMNIFCSFLGSAAGDQVLCSGSTGGLVLAGGILPRFVDFLKQSPFRQRFETKGSMSSYTKNVPTKLIVEQQPGLIGAAAQLNLS